MVKETESFFNHSLGGQLLKKIQGIISTQLIFVAAKLNIADLLEDRPMSVDELADATGTHPHRLYRIMRSLACLNIFAEKEKNYFALTPLSKLLQTEVEGSLRNVALLFGSEWHVHAWSHILNSVKKEESALKSAFGTDLFEYLAQHCEDAAIFNNAMASISKQHDKAICDAYDFSEFHTIVDVGGGQGSLLTNILKSYQFLKGILFEFSSTVKGADAFIRAERINDRCQIIEGDFFTSVTKGGDAYILKHIIHDWDDEIARKILQNCRDAIRLNGKLLIVESVIERRSKIYRGSKLLDTQMQVLTSGGRERTESEFRNLLYNSGFKLNRIITIKFDLKIIEGVPV